MIYLLISSKGYGKYIVQKPGFKKFKKKNYLKTHINIASLLNFAYPAVSVSVDLHGSPSILYILEWLSLFLSISVSMSVLTREIGPSGKLFSAEWMRLQDEATKCI